MYHLTGDRSRAELAKEWTRLAMKGHTGQDETWLYNWYIEGVALAYDMNYDAWDESFRQEVAAWLERVAWKLTFEPRDWRPQDMTVGIRDFAPYGSELAMIRINAGLAALAILNDPIPAPTAVSPKQGTHEPRWQPFTTGLVLPDAGRIPARDVTIADGTHFTPGKDAPIVKFAHDAIITQWLHAGINEDPAWRPFTNNEKDPLEALGGSAKAAPGAGTTFGYLDNEATFAPLSKDTLFAEAWTDFRPAINLLRDQHYKNQTLETFHTVIDNDKPRYVKLMLGNRWQWWPKIWVGGKIVREGEAFKLEAGKIPLTIQARTPLQQNYAPYFPVMYGRLNKDGTLKEKGRRGSWHYHWAALDQYAVPPLPRHDIYMQPRLVDVGDAPALWAADHAAWQANGKSSPHAQRILDVSLRSVDRYFASAMGDHAWGSGNSDHDEAMEMLITYAHALRTAAGKDILASTGAQWLVPLAMIDGESAWRNDRGPAHNWMGAAFATVPDAHKPAVAWYLREKDYPASMPHALMLTLINAPWRTEAKHPKDILPLTLLDQRAGAAVLRSGWDKNDVIAIFDASAQPARSAARAGEFAIYGGGAGDWIHRFNVGGGTAYYPRVGACSVVTMQNAWPVAGGTLVRHALQPDGSGSLTARLDKAYYHATPDKVTGMLPGMGGLSGFGADWGNNGPPRNANITALRAFAADYSGKSGAKALFVIVDAFANDNNRPKTWRMNLAANKKIQDVAIAAKTGTAALPGRSFTVAPPEGPARLHVNMIYPPDAKLTVDQLGTTVGTMQFVRADSPSNGYFVILTLHDGPAPDINTQGEGLNASVTVGKQTIRFDGERITFGP